MGLGRSIGTVTGPLSYLAERFQRWDESDQAFFGTSGERAQRDAGIRVGDVQALVLFASPEVYAGTVSCYEYRDNPAGRATSVPLHTGEPLRQALRRHLPKVWKPLKKETTKAQLFWCEVDPGNLQKAFERAAAVLQAARAPGGLGKEVWINLTGGSNVVNLALQLAAGLTGQTARYYYVQAADREAESCLRHTRTEGYWVDLPLLPLAVDGASRALVEIVAGRGPLPLGALLDQARTDPKDWSHFHEVHDSASFYRQFVRPLVQQTLLAQEGDVFSVGPGWQRLRPYYQVLDDLQKDHPQLGQLARQVPWFHEEQVSFA